MSDYYELRDYLRQLTAPKPAPIKVEPMSIAELPARARTILDGGLTQPRVDPVVQHDQWRKRKVWTASQAAWLALGIDPWTTEPWKYPRDSEMPLRAIAAMLTDALQGQGLDRESPEAFANALKGLGVHLDWMLGTNAELRQQAILDAIAQLGIDPMRPKKLDKANVGNHLQETRPDLFGPKSTNPGGTFDKEWSMLREQGKIDGNSRARVRKRPESE